MDTYTKIRLESATVLQIEAGIAPLTAYFDGPLPKPGDVVEFVCFEATETTIKCRFRVRAPNSGRPEQ